MISSQINSQRAGNAAEPMCTLRTSNHVQQSKLQPLTGNGQVYAHAHACHIPQHADCSTPAETHSLYLSISFNFSVHCHNHSPLSLPPSAAPAVAIAMSLPPGAEAAGALRELRMKSAVREMTGWQLKHGSQERAWLDEATGMFLRHMQVGGGGLRQQRAEMMETYCTA
jgi:hypothetical protein